MKEKEKRKKVTLDSKGWKALAEAPARKINARERGQVGAFRYGSR